MPRVAAEPIPLVKLEDFEPTEIEAQMRYEVNRALSRIGILFQQYAASINNIKLGDNLGEAVTVEFDQAGTEVTATHTMNRVPVAIIGIALDKPGAIYMSQSASVSEVYLTSDTDSLSATLYLA